MFRKAPVAANPRDEYKQEYSSTLHWREHSETEVKFYSREQKIGSHGEPHKLLDS
jgi:hypothetical protein